MELLMLIDGDASTIVLHGDRVILVDCHFYVGAIACHRLIDRVVNGLVDQVVQSLFTDVTDIHGGALAHCL